MHSLPSYAHRIENGLLSLRFIFILYMIACMYVCESCTCLLSVETRSRRQIPWSWRNHQLWSTILVLLGTSKTLNSPATKTNVSQRSQFTELGVQTAISCLFWQTNGTFHLVQHYYVFMWSGRAGTWTFRKQLPWPGAVWSNLPRRWEWRNSISNYSALANWLRNVMLKCYCPLTYIL